MARYIIAYALLATAFVALFLSILLWLQFFDEYHQLMARMPMHGKGGEDISGWVKNNFMSRWSPPLIAYTLVTAILFISFIYCWLNASRCIAGSHDSQLNNSLPTS